MKIVKKIKIAIVALLIIITAESTLHAQKVGINTSSVAGDAVIEIEGLVGSNYKGMIPPRMSTNERNSINASTNGLVIYNTSTKSLQYFDGNTWSDVGTPKGAIMMWNGSTPPAGWAICNGSNGTPDLRDRFIVGSGGAYSVGNTGGSAAVSLTTGQMPSHTHSFSGTTNSNGAHTHTVSRPERTGVGNVQSGTVFRADNGGGSTHSVTSSSNGSHSHTFSGTTSSQGSNQAHENRPPYYALAYIMKL